MIELLETFHLARPEALIALPVIVFLLYYLSRKSVTTQGWQKSIDPDLLQHLIDKPQQASVSIATHYPRKLATLLCCLAMIALAGPSFEKLPQPPLRQQQALVIIADLTLSMHAEDLKPSRLVRMRYKLLELLKQRREGQTALIAYSGDAHIVSPLTDDSNTIAALVPALKPEIMPQIGSNAGAAFAQAEQLLGNSNANSNGNNKVVWFTDSFHDSDQRALKTLAKARNITLIIVGIGTTDGAPVRLPSGKFLKGSNDQIVKPRLDKRGFKKLANQLGGHYIDLQNDNSDIDYILSEHFKLTSNVSEIEEAGYQFDQWLDRGAWLLLFITPLAALAFRRGWLLCIAFVAAGLQSDPIQAIETDASNRQEPSLWQSLWQTPDQQAYRFYQQGQLEEAEQHFKDTNWKGVSAYQQEDYKAAQQAFLQSVESGDKQNAQSLANAHYNGGHALARSGQLEKAIAAYHEALALTPDFEHAKQALALVEKMLSEQQQQSEQSDQQSGSDQSDQAQSDSDQSNSDQSNSEQSNSEQSESEQSDSEQTDSEKSEQQQSSSNSQQQQNSADNPSSAQQTEQQSAEETAEENRQVSAMTTPDGQPMDPEQAATLEQWLNKIKDDPAGLLRRKFQYERQLRERSGDVVQPDEEGSIW
jgi:Ca-activated chloride channel family protein